MARGCFATFPILGNLGGIKGWSGEPSRKRKESLATLTSLKTAKAVCMDGFQSRFKTEEVRCRCGSVMNRKFTPKRKQWFYGCSRFPSCRGVRQCSQINGQVLPWLIDREIEEFKKKHKWV